MGFAKSKEINYINFNKLVREQTVNPYGEFGFFFNISNRIVIQKRTVYTLLMMFGDVGGLSDFLVLGLSAFFTMYEEPMMLASMVEKLFLFTS